MSMDRREFIKLAGLSTLLGLGGAAAIVRLRGGDLLEAAEVSQGPLGLTAKRWGMVIDVAKFKAHEDYKKVMDACHKLHNVPHFTSRKTEIKWIWTDTYEHTFPGTSDEFMPEHLKEKPFPVLCNHCAQPACVRVCPTKATFKRPDGIVVMDYHRCIGCRFCMAACPFGARSFNWRDPRDGIREEDLNKEYPTRTKGVVEKCTFCVERLEEGLQPACVEASGGAMVYGDLDDPGSEPRRILAGHYAIRRRPELGTQPSIYYVIGGNEDA